MTCATPAKSPEPRSSAREWFSRCRRFPRPPLLMAALALASLVGSSGTGQPPLESGTDAWELSGSVRLEDADHVARSRLERLDRFLASQQWEEAVETLMTVMDESGEAVIPVTGMQSPTDDGFSRYVTLRTYCQIRLARLAQTAPEALATYRGRVDPLAEQWYREGVANRDADRLRQVLDQFFVSSWGDDALLAWGELQLQRGRFGLARGAWERIGSATRVPESPPEWLPGLPGRPLWLEL